MYLNYAKRFLAAAVAFAVLFPALLTGGYAGSWIEDDGYFGDLDLNHKIDASDALLCLQASVQLISLTSEQSIVGDVDANGAVNAADALLILQMSVELIASFPAYEQSLCDPTPSSDTVTSNVSSLPATSSEPSSVISEAISEFSSEDLSVVSSSSSEVSSATSSTHSSEDFSDSPSSTPEVSSASSSSSSSSESSSSSSVVLLPDDPEIQDFGYTVVDSSEYYCYAQLSRLQRTVYEIMHENALNMTQGKFAVGDAKKVNQADVRLAFLAYMNDHPEVFWLSKGYLYSESSGMVYVYFSDNGKNVDYLYSKAQRDLMQEELLNAVKTVFQEALIPGLIPFEREMRLHDWLAEHCKYNNAAVSAPNRYPEAFTSYGALISRTAVCEGYARALQLLCYYAGIQSTVVTGVSSDVPHMWNAVLVDDWYLVDATWDAGSPATHTFFNQTSDIFAQTHTMYAFYNTMTEQELLESIGFNFILPEFDATTYEYHRLYGVVTTAQTASAEFAVGVAQRVNAGADVVEIMVTDMVFQTMEEVSEFVDPYISKIIENLDGNRIPQRYSYSIVPGSSCIVLTFLY